jgi:hypothetical protein
MNFDNWVPNEDFPVDNYRVKGVSHKEKKATRFLKVKKKVKNILRKGEQDND